MATVTEWHDNLHRWFCGAFGGVYHSGVYYYNLQGNLILSGNNNWYFQANGNAVSFVYFDDNGNQLSEYNELKNYTWAAGNNQTEVSNTVAITGSSSITPTGASLTVSHVVVCMTNPDTSYPMAPMPLARINIDATITNGQTLTTSFVAGIEV
jgi:hypothetical protein